MIQSLESIKTLINVNGLIQTTFRPKQWRYNISQVIETLTLSLIWTRCLRPGVLSNSVRVNDQTKSNQETIYRTNQLPNRGPTLSHSSRITIILYWIDLLSSISEIFYTLSTLFPNPTYLTIRQWLRAPAKFVDFRDVKLLSLLQEPMILSGARIRAI